ncbi:MAG TPA: class I SAM-dependent methyltransferase [Actinomycetota bacterium]|nr:class I SAM-dependent methyltransferase [Actinomycetota bacterium]
MERDGGSGATTPTGTLMGANENQRRAWNGAEGRHRAENADQYDDGMRFLTPVLMRAADLRPRDRVLDIGCGNGETTLLAAEAASQGRAVGIDLSEPMIEIARARAAERGVKNAEFIAGDAQTHPLPQRTFDVAISRTGTMFFDDPVAAFANVARSLAAGGRLVMLVWRRFEDNRWLTDLRGALAAGRVLPEPPTTGPGPFVFADQRWTTHMLGAAGFSEIDLQPVDEPFSLGADPDDAFARAQRMVLVQGLLNDLDPDARARALDELRKTIHEHETDRGVVFRSSSWLVRATLAE